MDSFVKRSGMKVSEEIRKTSKSIYFYSSCFSSLTVLFCQARHFKGVCTGLCKSGASYGCVPAEQFIVGYLTVKNLAFMHVV